MPNRCELNRCWCAREWFAKGWICPALLNRAQDVMVCKGDLVGFGQNSRIWIGKHSEPSSRLLGGHGWHGSREYVVHDINRTEYFTQVKVRHVSLGIGWVNVWRSYKSGNVAVWAQVNRRALPVESVLERLILATTTAR